ncbi:hypothetical protein HPB49_002181 [Dermacentor silvarum]|uniref:Uncharacterized protein n=1 Tax=Dermacentor silvarum TaxID=543639 RepID=A0ACB8CUT7_DERSI|nr:hypothetical protein HPB49_002181 [Dermacentor silvarum]
MQEVEVRRPQIEEEHRLHAAEIGTQERLLFQGINRRVHILTHCFIVRCAGTGIVTDQLVFEAKLRPRIPGMIAIDNFVLNDTRCSSDKDGACNFESDSCGWLLNNWERTSGSSSVLPAVDQSTMSPSGSYALAKAPGGRMVSPKTGTMLLSRSVSASGSSSLVSIRKR